VVVEAMAAGVVPVAMDKLGPSDIITHEKDGLLSKLNDDDFTQNIVRVLSDDSFRRKLSENALLTAKDYSQDNITKKLLGLYGRATSNHNST
jgi:glycosyltransferase involved in cell wall biosynthesis